MYTYVCFEKKQASKPHYRGQWLAIQQALTTQCKIVQSHGTEINVLFVYTIDPLTILLVEFKIIMCLLPLI